MYNEIYHRNIAYCDISIQFNKLTYSLQGRAKQLYTCGFKTLSLVVNADPDDIVKLVKQIPKKVAKQIVSSAKVLIYVTL